MIRSSMKESGDWNCPRGEGDERTVPYVAEAAVEIDMAQERIGDTVTVHVTLPTKLVEEEPGSAEELIGACGITMAQQLIPASREIAKHGLAGAPPQDGEPE